MDPILKIENLSKAFGGLQAVIDFDLEVLQGDIIGLIGPNGAGKTTIFNLITGFIKPDQGQVNLKGERVTGLKPFQIVNRGMVRTFQLVDLFKEMTALENVMIALYSHRGKEKKGREVPYRAALSFLEEVGIEGKFKEQAGNLAFGELRLLDIARAMATGPDILLLGRALLRAGRGGRPGPLPGYPADAWSRSDDDHH